MSSVRNSRNLKKTIKKELESSNMLEEKVIEIPNPTPYHFTKAYGYNQ